MQPPQTPPHQDMPPPNARVSLRARAQNQQQQHQQHQPQQQQQQHDQLYGFDVNRFLERPEDDMICAICHGVFNKPVNAPRPCEHIFCLSCITRWFGANSQKSCPVCKREIKLCDLAAAPRVVTNLLGKLKIRCRFAANGCRNDTITLATVESHEKTCNHALCECPNKCGLRLPRHAIHAHTTAQCDLREVECPNGCSAQQLLVKDVEVHLATACPYSQTRCPQCDTAVLRSRKQHHLMFHCPVTIRANQKQKPQDQQQQQQQPVDVVETLVGVNATIQRISNTVARHQQVLMQQKQQQQQQQQDQQHQQQHQQHTTSRKLSSAVVWLSLIVCGVSMCIGWHHSSLLDLQQDNLQTALKISSLEQRIHNSASSAQTLQSRLESTVQSVGTDITALRTTIVEATRFNEERTLEMLNKTTTAVVESCKAEKEAHVAEQQELRNMLHLQADVIAKLQSQLQKNVELIDSLRQDQQNQQKNLQLLGQQYKELQQQLQSTTNNATNATAKGTATNTTATAKPKRISAEDCAKLLLNATVVGDGVDWTIKGVRSKWANGFGEFSHELTLLGVGNSLLQYTFMLYVTVNFDHNKNHVGIFFIPRRGMRYLNLEWPIQHPIRITVTPSKPQTNSKPFQKVFTLCGDSVVEWLSRHAPPHKVNTESTGWSNVLDENDVNDVDGWFGENGVDDVVVHVELLAPTFADLSL